MLRGWFSSSSCRNIMQSALFRKRRSELLPSPGKRTLRTSAGTWRASRTSPLPQSLSSRRSFCGPAQETVQSPLFLTTFDGYVILVLWIPATIGCLHIIPIKCDAHTWNIFFSDPLCLAYSFGKNSFRLWREKTSFMVSSSGHRRFPFC